MFQTFLSFLIKIINVILGIFLHLSQVDMGYDIPPLATPCLTYRPPKRTKKYKLPFDFHIH